MNTTLTARIRYVAPLVAVLVIATGCGPAEAPGETPDETETVYRHPEEKVSKSVLTERLTEQDRLILETDVQALAKYLVTYRSHTGGLPDSAKRVRALYPGSPDSLIEYERTADKAFTVCLVAPDTGAWASYAHPSAAATSGTLGTCEATS